MDQISTIGSYGELSYSSPHTQALTGISSTSYTSDLTENESKEQQHFSNGQIVSGEITDLKNNEVTIQLSNDTTITAKLTDSSPLNIGQVVTFKATVTPDGFTLTPIPTNADPQAAIIDKALLAASLPKNIKNISIAKELLNNNMSIDKQSILKILAQSYQNKDVSINTLVVMNKHNIPITKDNAISFENLRNNEHRIVSKISTIANEVTSSLKDNPSINSVLRLNKEYISLLSSSNFSTVEKTAGSISSNQPLLIESYTSPMDEKNLSNILKMFGANDELINKIENQTATLRETAIAINHAKETATVMDLSNAYGHDTSSLPTSLANAADVFLNPSIETVLKDYASLQNNNNELSSYMNDFGRGTLISMIKGLPGSQTVSDEIWNGNINSKELLSKLNNLISFMPPNKAAAFISSTEYTTILNQAITSEWTITPHDLTKEGRIQEKYQNMYEQVSKLSQIVASASPDSEPSTKLEQTSGSLKSNIDFMHTLNEMFTYVQLPLRLKGKNVHSDLYVMTNKKKLAKNNSSISVLLHLDMENLKPVDINVNLNNNQVTARFYMSDSMSKAIVETNMEHLELALLEKGFLFTSQVLDKKEDIDIVKDFIDKDTPATSLKRYSFDIRA